MINIRLSDLSVALFYITFIGVFTKSLSLPFLSDHANKIEFLFLISLFVVCLLIKLPSRLRYKKEILIFYFIYAVLSLASSFDSFETINFIQLLLNSKFILAVLVFSAIQSVNFENVYRVIFYLLVLNSLFIFLNLLSPNIYSSIMSGAITDTIIQGTSYTRYSGAFYHPAPMGAFSSCTLIISIIRIFSTRKLNKDFIVLALSLFSILASGQRLESLAVFIALLVCYLVKNLKNKVYLIGFITVIPIMLYAIYANLQPTTSAKLDNHSNARYVLYIGGVQLAGEYFPLGRGLSTYGSSTSEVSSDNAYSEVGIDRMWWYEGASYLTDTFWAMIIGESGWLAAGCYLLILLLLMKNSYDKLNLYRYKDERWIFLVGMTLSIYLLINSLASPVYSGATLPILIASLFIGHENLKKSFD